MKIIKKQIRQAAAEIGRQADVFAKSLGITGMQMSIIDFLASKKDYSVDQHAIETEFDIQRSTTTVMLQRMEKRGLIDRVADKTDKRRKKVRLSLAAQQLIPPIREFIKNDDLELNLHFSPEEIATAQKVLTYIKERKQYE